MDSIQTETIGNYRVISKLGQGGMGAVFKAVQGTLERPCALKLLPPELSSNHEYVQRFLREARSVAQLRHENIVQVYDAGQDGGRYFIAMELVDGTDLQTHIEKKGVITEAEGLSLLLQAAKGLAAAHAKSLVHRDIKPHNLLMGNDGVLRIVDFGLVMESTSTTQLTATGACLGTPMYMSPEQADGEQADSRTDVYSLGVTFFRVFTGQLPFNSNTVMNLLFKHKFEAPPDPHKLRPDLSENVRRLLLHMIAKRREDRPQDGSKIVEMIETILAKKKLPPPPISSTPGGATSILMPQGTAAVAGVPARKTPPWPLIAAGAAAVLIVAVLAFALFKKGTDPRIAQGEIEFQAGRYKEAQQLFQQAQTSDPKNEALKTRLEQADRALRVSELLDAAKALESANDLNGALARFNDAAALDNSGKARAELERLRALMEKNVALSGQQRDADRDRYSKAAADAEKAGQFDTAAEHYSRAASLAEAPLKGVLADKAQECRRQDYLAQALKEEKRGNLTEAELFYRRALDVKRDGLVEQQLAELQKKKTQNQAVALEPAYDAAMRDGQRAMDAGDYPNARKKFKEAQGVKANDAVAANKLKETDGRELITRGDGLRAQGHKDEAVAAYTEAIQKWPPLGIEATQRIQAAAVGAPPRTSLPATHTPAVPVIPVNPTVSVTPQPAAASTVSILIGRIADLVREKRDNEALQEMLQGLKTNPGNKELGETKEALDSLQGTLGVYAELQKIVESGKLRVSETLDIGDEARIRETNEKLDAQLTRNSERSDEARTLFVKKDYNAIKALLRSARNEAGDLSSELSGAASYLEQRAEKAADGSGIKLFGGVRLGTSGDKRKAERFRNVGDGFRRLSEQARAQSK